jgi:5-methylcytosine-specific restriction enzyme subunit McrC
VNLVRYEFDPNPSSFRDGFYSYYRIGAEWIDEEQTRTLVVVPKMQNIDFIEMFMTCLQGNETSDNFSTIYDIDFEAKPIKSKALSAILSPLLVVQYLMVVKRIATKGLRRDYISRTETLLKVKGRINLRQTERFALLGHREQVHCTFDDYSVDNPENRLLKKALIASRGIISHMTEHKAYAKLFAMCNHCLSVFENVSYDCNDKMPILKSNKLYREYSEAIRIARMILRRQDVAVHKYNTDTHLIPVFRMDMALLFEHYALANLRRAFGESAVQYQAKGYHSRFRPDFLVKKDDLRIIIDAKYTQPINEYSTDLDYIKQLSAYSRDKVILKSIGYDTTNENSIPIVPCLIVYPSITYKVLSPETVLTQPVKQTEKFYIYPINIPTQNESTDIVGI